MAIVSFRYGFIFCKTRKTAGTSMEVHLAQACGPGDIITPILPTRRGHEPRNYEGRGGMPGYRNHMTMNEIRLQTPNFDSFFRFAFERHPVDKCLSHYAMLKNSPLHFSPSHPPTWEAYLEAGRFPEDSNKYLDEKGELLVDILFRYEEIDTALRQIEERTSLPYRPLTVKEKSGFRYNVPSFDEVMASATQRDLIMSAFHRTLAYVSY